MSQHKSAVVIGGGVIGTACAHYLSEAGWQVTILDKGRFAGACSHGNCGLICPSHVLPLAEPGAVRGAIKAMLSRNAPFSIKPRLDWALWTWLLSFARRCNERDMLSAGRAIQPLLDSSMALYRDLVERVGLECEWESRGLLFAYKDAGLMEAYAKVDRLLGETFGHPAERYDGAALTQLEPALREDLAGGWYYRSDAHLRPDRLMASWRKLLESRGVAIREGCDARGFVPGGAGAAAALTSDGEVPADAFIVAAGALTPRLAAGLGCRVPIQPGKGYSITMPRPARCPQIPMIFPETRVAVTPMKSGYRLGSTMEFAGYDESIHPRRLDLLRQGARPYLHEPIREPEQEVWYGWRPMTCDSLPLIGPAPALPNVILAAGHNMLGMSMAPATGRLVAEMLGGQSPHVDPVPYLPARF